MMTRLQKLPPPSLAIALSLVLFCTMAWGITTWTADWQLIHESAPAIDIKPNHPMAAETSAVNSHLFGQALTADGGAPITNLALRVVGISKVFNESGNDVSRATISIAGDAGKSYQVGDALPDGVKIIGIERHFIMLENNDHLEKLPLPREQLIFKPRASPEDFS